MSSFPVFVRSVSPSGEARYVLGDPVVDRYLEFVGGRCRVNTLWDEHSWLQPPLATAGDPEREERQALHVPGRSGLRSTTTLGILPMPPWRLRG